MSQAICQHFRISEVAERLAVSEDTIRVLIDRGELDLLEITSACKRIPEDSVLDFLSRRRKPACNVSHKIGSVSRASRK